jgi:hypothetical protein
MKVIAFQYHQLLVNASDAGRSKIGLPLNTLQHHSVRLLPVTTASQAMNSAPARKLLVAIIQYSPAASAPRTARPMSVCGAIYPIYPHYPIT